MMLICVMLGFRKTAFKTLRPLSFADWVFWKVGNSSFGVVGRLLGIRKLILTTARAVYVTGRKNHTAAAVTSVTNRLRLSAMSQRTRSALRSANRLGFADRPGGKESLPVPAPGSI